MSKVLGVALGILTAIGGFLDIGDLVTNAVVGSRFGLGLAWVVVVETMDLAGANAITADVVNRQPRAHGAAEVRAFPAYRLLYALDRC